MRRSRADRSLALASACWAALACSVFPDRAVLPDDAGSGFAGALLADAGAGGATGGSQATGGNAGVVGDLAGTAGDTAGGTAGDTVGGAAATGGAAGGATNAGAGGGAGCAPLHVVLPATADAWIASAEPQVNHGSDTELFVFGGISEQRALLTFSLPAAPMGAALVAAKLALTLSETANPGAQSRTLNAYALSKSFNEGRVTWSNYGNGASHQWTTPGGDTSSNFGSGLLDSGAAQLVLDITALASAAYSAQQTELGLLVRDPAPGASAPSAFVSKEGALTAQPALDLEYCRP